MSVPAIVEIKGRANAAATVTVNNHPAYRRGEYFRVETPVANGSGPAYPALAVLGVLNNGTNPDLVTNRTGNVFVPQSPESFTHQGVAHLGVR